MAAHQINAGQLEFEPPTSTITMMRCHWLLVLCTGTFGSADARGIQHPLSFLSKAARSGERLPQDPYGPERVDTPEIVHDAAPKSPSPAPDWNYNNDKQKVEYVAGELADGWASAFGKGSVGGMPSKFDGSTCKQVCAACTIAAVHHPGCKCTAKCLKGADATQCDAKIDGWANEQQTISGEAWEARCNAGKVDCSKCIDEQVKYELGNCTKELVPGLCQSRLLSEYGGLGSTKRYCSKEGNLKCEQFDHTPPENGWTCYATEGKCTENLKDPLSPAFTPEDARAYEDNYMTVARETPCIFCKLTGIGGA